MSVSARVLFRDLVDVSQDERQKIFAKRQVATALRAEVESLLRFDSSPGVRLTRRVSAAVEEVRVPAEQPPPRYCGPYRLVDSLGSGGMGAVYLAERGDGEIEQKVAVKLLRNDADRPSWRDRFLRERQLLAYLNHPSITRVLDAGHTDDGRPYLVMEYVQGVTIDEYASTLDLSGKLQLFLLVCDGVSHAHRQSIVHRDLKPSNILVDSSGHPKLLDFGIAKLLDVTLDQTKTVERLLTPGYASPEQLRGDAQTTATDIYSLGAVLYHLLTGRSPHEPSPDSLPASRQTSGESNVTTPSRLNPTLPRDIDYILRKAMRHEPSERYASVDAFADDIRAFLELRPVKARSGDTWYRTRKFLRRYRLPVAAATITIASLYSGLEVANYQRAIAQQRFQQVRQLATRVLALDKAIGGMELSTKARNEVVAMSKGYLEALGAEAHKDHELALEVGEAYLLLARAQGISFDATTIQKSQAEESLRMADSFVEPVLRAKPENRRALLIAAGVSHDRMIMAETNRRKDEIHVQTRRSVEHLDKLVGLGALSEVESETVSQLYYHISLSRKNLRLHGEAIRYAQRSIEVARQLPDPHLRLSLGLSMLANVLRLTGDLEGALQAIREARVHLDKARFPSDSLRRSTWANVVSREGKILGAASGISLNRPDEAIPPIQKAFNLIEEWTQHDPEDAWSRLLLATAGQELGDILRLREPRRALQVYDHSLRRVREVKNNMEARRAEAELLAGSSYALRRLNRSDEGKARIDAALRLLGETHDYPTDRITPHEVAHVVLRALGDHLAETGQPTQGAEVYQNLLDRVTESKPDLKDDLGASVAMSQIYGSLAALNRRSGQPNRGEMFAGLRMELWRYWDHKLPNNGLVRRNLESARLHY